MKLSFLGLLIFWRDQGEHRPQNFARKLLLAIALTGFLSAPAYAEISRFLNIHGKSYELILIEKSTARYGIDDAGAGNKHFDLYLKDFPDSQGRAAFIDGQWQGLFIHDGQMHLIEDLAEIETESKSFSRALADDFSVGKCGVASRTKPEKDAMREVTMASLTPKRSQIQFNQFCQETVDDVCIVAELTVVFDSEFQSAFGSSYRSQATSLLENLDFIYRENFNIVFNKIHLGFGDGNNLSPSNNIETVLDDIADKRSFGQSANYDPNTQSIFHFVTGRNYAANNDNTIGLAYISAYTNYPNGVEPLLCTPYATGTSQVIGSGNSKAAYTSILVAHEIGHNFGFDHDGESGSFAISCDGDSFIMSPYLNPSYNEFSSCSNDAIAPNINEINNIESCFDFPTESSIMALANPTTLSELSPFINQYSISSNTLTGITANLQVTGHITSGDASFSSVTLGGNNCTLSNNSQGYSCSTSTPNIDTTLSLSIVPINDDIPLEHDVFYSSANIYELDDNDNSLIDSVRFRGPNLSPSNLSGSASETSIALSWTDRSTNESSYLVERKISGADWEPITNNLAASSQQYTATDLEKVAEYQFRVTAVFPDSSTATSNEITIKTAHARQERSVPSKSSGGSLSWLGLIPPLFLLFRRRRTNCDHPHSYGQKTR